MRQPINEDADTAHNARVTRVGMSEDDSLVGSFSSQTINAPVVRRDTRRSSISFFVRGLGRSSSDIGPPTSEVPTSRQGSHGRQDSEGTSSTRSVSSNQRERKMPFLLPSAKEEDMAGRVPNAMSISGDSVRGSNHGQRASSSMAKGTLKDRRNVNLELALPVGLPVLPAQHRSPEGYLSSITPSRPRSPKTPFARSEQPRFTQFVAPMTSPIMEEDYIGHITFSEGNEMFRGFPDNDIIGSSHSPEFEHPSIRPRNRGPCPRRRSKRSRSGHSMVNEDGTPRTRNDSPNVQAQQARVDAKLEQFSRTTRDGRQNRWRWARSTASRSSDGASANTSLEPSTRRCSMNPFKRSGRISDQADQTRDPSPPSRLWWIGKQPAAPARADRQIPSTSPPVAGPPVFVPPRLAHAATPPTLVVHGDVKGKLADFFFDHTAGLEGRKAEPSPGGHWDSDALLMSYLSPDLKLGQSKEDEEEGPEGPVTPLAPRGFTVDHNPGCPTPGLVEAPGGYLNAKGPYSTLDQAHSPCQTKAWFRVRQYNADDSYATAQSPEEIEERKKFEWIVPEHLPNSPLCPKHAGYTGYSAGICYWHGRRPSKIDAPIRMEGEVEEGVYEMMRREKAQRGQARQHGDMGEAGRPQRGVKGWQVGDIQNMPAEETRGPKKRRLASLSTPD
jgi:hypothetical protein